MSVDDNKGGGWMIVVPMALMALCCGGPLIVLGIVAVGPAVLATLGSPPVVVLAVAVVAAGVIGLVLRRRAKACASCEPAGRKLEAWSRES